MTSRARARAELKPRRGRDRPPRPWSNQQDGDHTVFEVECGKGTYVRSLARDMGRALGCFGHVSALRRTAVGPFDERDMIPLEQLEALCNRAASGEGSLADALFAR